MTDDYICQCEGCRGVAERPLPEEEEDDMSDNGIHRGITKTAPTDKPADETAEKPSLEEAIKFAKEELAEWEEMLQGGCIDQGVCLRTGIPVLRRLVEAAEFEQRNASKAFDCYNARWKGQDDRCPIREKFEAQLAEKDRRIRQLKAELTIQRNCVKEAQKSLRLAGKFAEAELQTVRCQLDALGKENAEKEGRIEQLQVAEKERELERLEDELDDLRLSTNPEFIAAMTKILQGLQETNIDWSRAKKRTIFVDDPEPTEAEVEKVANCLRIKYWGGEMEGWRLVQTLPVAEKHRWLRLSRHLIARGYRPEE